MTEVSANSGLTRHNALPPGIRGDDFCVISQTGGATAKLQEPGWGHIQGGRLF